MRLLVWLVVGSFLLVIFAKIRELLLRPEAAIKAAFHQTKYSHLIPYVIAQSKHETGNYSSDVFKSLKNMFGMRNAKVRPQLGEFNLSGYRKYQSRFDSAMDFLHWLHYNEFPEKINSATYYVKKLKDLKYFEDSEENYLNGLRSWM
jgi:hypothetical protein